MKLVTYRAHVESAARLGVLEGDLVIDVARLAAAQGLAAPDSMLGLIDEGPAGLKALRRLLDKQGGVYPMGVSTAFANVSLLAPIPRPRKNIFGIGLNYVEHVAESAQALDTAKELPKQPVIFSKPPTTVVGPGTPSSTTVRSRASSTGRWSSPSSSAPPHGVSPRQTRCAMCSGIR
jgi:2-keto-4-pentenoate hydratase/2-oxohepta-3-ene-1,7-dioic acid hydratase in catechol pathway